MAAKYSSTNNDEVSSSPLRIFPQELPCYSPGLSGIQAGLFTTLDFDLGILNLVGCYDTSSFSLRSQLLNVGESCFCHLKVCGSSLYKNAPCSQHPLSPYHRLVLFASSPVNCMN